MFELLAYLLVFVVGMVVLCLPSIGFEILGAWLNGEFSQRDDDAS